MYDVAVKSYRGFKNKCKWSVQLPGIDLAHEKNANVQRYSVGEKMEVIPNTFKEAMTLPAKAHCKAASDKEVASLKKNNVYTHVPAIAVPAGHKIIGSRWVYKVKADTSYKGRVVVLGWGTRRRPRRHVCSGLQASEHPYGAGDSGGVRP